MVSNRGADDSERSKPRSSRGSLGRLFLRVAGQIFGGTVVRTEPPARPARPREEPQEPIEEDAELITVPEPSLPRPGPVLKRSQQSAEAAHTLERTLDHFEAMLEALEAQVKPNGAATAQAPVAPPAEAAGSGTTEAMNNGTIERLQEMLNRLATQAQRLADGASDLAEVAGQMEARLGEVTRATRGATVAAPVARRLAVEEAVLEPAEEEPIVLEPDEAPVTEAPTEPQFEPGDTPLSVALAGVPGFQGLMDAQRALNGLAQSESASVVAFKNGEASLEVTLNAPVTARQIVESVRDGTGEPLLIEESRPDVGKLRLRFVSR